MPDGTVPSSTEALRAALAVAKASLETQLSVAPSAAAETALREVQSALRLLPSDRIIEIQDAVWTEADVAAPAAPAAVPPAADTVDTRDDLTRIRGIDQALSQRLAALGIHRFAQIAAWELDDVRVIADAMGLGRRFLAMGIIEQASELERQRQEAARVTARHTPPAQDRTSVAIWTPTASSTASPATLQVPWKPLSPEERRRIAALVRTRLPMNRIVPLSELAPVLATPIYVATDRDTAIELPRWRTGVLVPFVEAQALRDPSPVNSRPAVPETSRRLTVAPPIVDPLPAHPPTRPLHELATTRIDELELALDTMSAPQSAPHHVAMPPAEAPATPPPAEARTPTSARRFLLGAAATQVGQADHAEEAEVRIVTNAHPRQRPLQSLPDLPLVPSRSGRHVPRAPDPSIEVEEAAVIIVRRQSPEREAGDLAFYKAAAAASPGPVRRFMRALAGG